MKKLIVSLIALLLVFPVAFAADGIQGVEGTVLSTTTTSLSAPAAANIRIIQSKYDPYPAEPGQYMTVWISVQNWGQKDIKDVYFRIKPEYPLAIKTGESAVKSVGIISALKERLLEWDLYVNEDAIEGVYEIEMIVCSDASCSTELRSSTAEVTVKTGGSPRIKVGLEEMANLARGMSGDITVNVVNKGDLDTKYLTMSLLESDNYEILSPQEAYIGELGSDDFETATYKLYIRPGVAAEKSEYIELPIRVEYTDDNNKDYSEESIVKMRIYTLDDMKKFGLVAGSSSSYGTIGIIVIAVLGFIWWRIKKKRRS